MTYPRTLRLAPLTLALCQASLAMGADDATLGEVIVKGQSLSHRNEAVSTTRLDHVQIREQRAPRVQELFQLVPGMDNRGLQINGVADAITLRGFTGGGHGGDLGAAIDGVPLNEPTSHADGYVDFNVIVPLELSEMAVHRGPVSVLYGNYARAGVVSLASRKGGSYREADLSLGSFGTLDAQLAYGSEAQGRRINLAAQGFRTDGARSRSDWRRGTLAGRIAYDLTPGTELALSGRYHSGTWNAIAQITENEFRHRSLVQRAHPDAQNDGGEKEYLSLRADLGVKLGDQIKLLGFAYGVDQYFQRFATFFNPTTLPWPQREESYDRKVGGAGINLNGRQPLGGIEMNWVAGIERYSDATDSRLRQNLIDRQDTAATAAGTLRNRRMRVITTSYFAQGEWAISPLLRPGIGVRHDRFTGNCRVLGAENNAGRCDELNAMSHTSPKLGLRSTVAPGVDLRASWAEGFQLPNDTLKYSVAGAEVEPTVFRQFEIGANTKLGANAILDAALFRIKSSGEIATDAATGIARNVGSTLRQGLEIDLRYAPAAQWELSAIGSWFRSEVLHAANADSIGKKVPSTPGHMLTLGATWRPSEAWSVNTSVRKIGAYAIDATNTRSYKGYTVAKLGVQYQSTGASGRPMRYYASIDNLFDRRYGTSVGFNSAANLWTYQPGAPRSLTVGAQFDF